MYLNSLLAEPLMTLQAQGPHPRSYQEPRDLSDSLKLPMMLLTFKACCTRAVNARKEAAYKGPNL